MGECSMGSHYDKNAVVIDWKWVESIEANRAMVIIDG